MAERRVVLALALLVALYLVFSAEHVRSKRANQDEGWYLMAARLVREGQRPIVDFAYVQPPLLPYVYALFGADAGVARGRWVGVGFGVLTLLAVGLAARRYGPGAVLLGASLMALTPFVLVQHSTVKTYALANACCAVGLLAAGDGTRRGGVIGAGVAFALAALTRNSSLPILPIYWLWLALAPERRKLLGWGFLAGLLPMVLVYAPFVAADAEAVRFHLIDHHSRNAASPNLARMVLTAAAVMRLQAEGCPALTMLLLAGAAGLAARRERPAAAAELGLAGLAFVGLAAAQFVSAHPYQEYQAVAMPPAALLCALIWGELLRTTPDRRLLTNALVAMAGAYPLLSMGPAIARLPGSTMGPEGVHGPLRQVAREVAARCGPDDEVFTFQTDVAIEAHRRLSPGLTLASFSFADVPDPERWHLVTPESITRTFEAAEPKVIVLAQGDLKNLLQARWEGARVVPVGPGTERYARLIAALNERYRRVGRVDGVGQFDESYDIFERVEEPAG